MTSVHLEQLTAAYGATQVVRDFTLHISAGEFVALLGPSGCGKTTVLKIIAGLLMPAGGELRFGEESVLRIPAERRGAVMVFQKPLLFPYLTVAENVAFGLKMRKLPKDEIRQRVSEALQLVQLDGYDGRRPNELSGGQEQRVALARALVTQPRVLLLDEPFSALDESLRAGMRSFVRELQQQLRITTVFVTHDQSEAAALADRIALMLGGRLEQSGAPRDFFTAPATPQAAQFFGWKLLTGKRNGRLFETAIGRFIIPKDYEGEAQMMALRPESVRLRQRGSDFLAESANNVTGIVESLIDLGTRIHYRVALEAGETLEVEQEIDDAALDTIVTPGHQVMLRIPNQNTRFFA